MRIVGGRFKGHNLFFISNPKVRPMTQMIREAVFSSVQDRVAGARVLDLFCGSGGVGLEALSRGAAWVDFVDLDPSCTRRNIAKLELADVTKVYKMDVFKALAKLARDGRRYDFIFIGAPYEFPQTGEILIRLDELCLLAPGGFIMIEHRSNRTFPKDYTAFAEHKVHKYGQTLVTRYEAKT